MQINQKINSILTVLLILIALSFFLFTPADLFNQALYLIFPLIATIVSAANFHKYGLKSENGKVWLLISVGLFSWAMGELIWYVLKYFLNIDPSISLADFFYLAAYPLLMVGLYKEYRLAKTGAKESALSGLIINIAVVVLSALVVYFGIYKAYDPTADNLNNFFAMVYGVVDLFLVIACLYIIKATLAYRGGKLFGIWLSMAIGFFIYLIGDVSYAIYSEGYSQELLPYAYIDLIWIAGYYVLAVAAVNNYYSLHFLGDKIKEMIAGVKK